MKYSHKELFLTLFLLSSTLADSWDWEFLISLKRKKAEILNIPRHTFTESREVFVWIQVKKPPYSDNDCFPTTIAQETEEIGSVNFKASHPNLPTGTQTFAVASNQTSMVKRVLCLSNFTQDSEKAISFEATVNKPVCRDVKVMLEPGGDECDNTLEYDSAEIQTNHSEIVIGVLVVMLVLVIAIAVRYGWEPISAMFKKKLRNVEDVEYEGSESLRPLESKRNDDNVPNSMGAQKRGESRNKNKIESEESESLRPLESKTNDDSVPKSMGAQRGGESRSKNKMD